MLAPAKRPCLNPVLRRITKNGVPMSSFEDQFVNVGTVGTRYWQAGSSGSVVVLVHGIGCSVLEWRSNIAELARHHRVYALDLVGYGLSDKPADARYSLREIAQHIMGFMDALGLARAHLAGNSLGGRLALECARFAPARVASMALVDPAGVGSETHINFRLATVPVLGDLLARPSRFGLRLTWRAAFFDPSLATPELIDEKLRFASQPGAQSAFMKTVRAFVGFSGFQMDQVRALQADMPAMQMPALVLWGREDHLLPVKQAEILRGLLPHVQVIVYERCGHMPQTECAQQFNQDVLAFWAKVDADGGS